MTRCARWVNGLGVLLAACGTTGPRSPDLAALESAQARWASAGLGAYVFAVQRQCFCPVEYRGPARLTVEDGVAVERVYVDSGLTVPEGYGFPTVDDLFAILRSAYESRAYAVTVTYDPVLGVALEAWIDYDEMVADEELGWLVTEAPTPVP